MTKRYSSDFKDSMIKLYHEGNSFKELSVRYGVSSDSIRHWVKQAELLRIKNLKSFKKNYQLQRKN